MAKEIKTSIAIEAAAAKVWAVLTHFDGYPAWNPFITSISGQAAAGEKIKVRIEPPGARAMTFTPRVLAFRENREFSWLGHLFIPGLFDGKHRFELIDNGDGTTTFLHSETFGGILVPLLSKIIDQHTAAGFQQMNIALKATCER